MHLSILITNLTQPKYCSRSTWKQYIFICILQYNLTTDFQRLFHFAGCYSPLAAHMMIIPHCDSYVMGQSEQRRRIWISDVAWSPFNCYQATMSTTKTIR